MTNIENKLNQKIFKNIDDVLVIKDRHIPIQFCIQNWGEPFNRPLLKKAVEIVLTSKSVTCQDKLPNLCHVILPISKFFTCCVVS